MKAIILIIALALALQADDQKQGPRGGCYTIHTSRKTGKQYKKYEPCHKAVK